MVSLMVRDVLKPIVIDMESRSILRISLAGLMRVNECCMESEGEALSLDSQASAATV